MVRIASLSPQATEGHSHRRGRISLQHQVMLDGVRVDRAFSSKAVDGEHVAFFSVWSEARVVQKIPLYRYRSVSGRIESFEAFPLMAVWGGT